MKHARDVENVIALNAIRRRIAYNSIAGSRIFNMVDTNRK